MGEERRPHAGLISLPAVKRGSPGSPGDRVSYQEFPGDITAPTAARWVIWLWRVSCWLQPPCHPPSTVHGTCAWQSSPQGAGWSPGQVWKDSTLQCVFQNPALHSSSSLISCLIPGVQTSRRALVPQPSAAPHLPKMSLMKKQDPWNTQRARPHIDPASALNSGDMDSFIPSLSSCF